MEEALKPKSISLIASSAVVPVTLQLHLNCNVKGVSLYILLQFCNMGLHMCELCLKMAIITGVCMGTGFVQGHLIKTDLFNTCALFRKVKHYNQVGGDAL